jgi:membrane-associated phospholipid phosphatase
VLKIVPRNASDALPAMVAGAEGAHAAWKLYMAAAVLAGLAVAALWIDLPVARYLTQEGLPGELRRLVRLAETFAWGGTVTLIIAVAATLDHRGWRVVPRLVVSGFGAGLVADSIKLFVARQRPSTGILDSVAATFASPGIEHSGRHAVQSFPSGHAATAVGLAIGLTALYPSGRWLFWTFAALAMLQRMEARAHYASDVLAGAAIACFVGAIYQRCAHGCCEQGAELR